MVLFRLGLHAAVSSAVSIARLWLNHQRFADRLCDNHFLDVFVVLGAICAIMGFVRLTNPR